MIELKKFEDSLLNCQLNETGKPFNKWGPETRTEMLQRSLKLVKELNSEIVLHKHELVIDDYKIVRLDDVIDDDDDFYWYYTSCTESYLASCVCQHTLLKEFIPDNEYTELVRVWNLNNLDKAI